MRCDMMHLPTSVVGYVIQQLDESKLTVLPKKNLSLLLCLCAENLQVHCVMSCFHQRTPVPLYHRSVTQSCLDEFGTCLNCGSSRSSKGDWLAYTCTSFVSSCTPRTSAVLSYFLLILLLPLYGFFSIPLLKADTAPKDALAQWGPVSQMPLTRRTYLHSEQYALGSHHPAKFRLSALGVTRDIQRKIIDSNGNVELVVSSRHTAIDLTIRRERRCCLLSLMSCCVLEMLAHEKKKLL
ncbi:hypothetical protein VFPPC_18045 [Pochonia chlamydosporia 170]|uniref:Uncharacterized protein n=1 Tax=Pochonia chlamydosporia 170 TaxID=1380566 RepID=A0A219APP7_METCM|nr:hypothetical protein VFPPC_18045 [Pochonia chlamydosporia 170]OWT42790.1 hypothetical protein VFPPC_18045 [Pochonia chlamydosporia 170]